MHRLTFPLKQFAILVDTIVEMRRVGAAGETGATRSGSCLYVDGNNSQDEKKS
jgi:hypothetical protein